ncbi:hypothetical protein [Streptomyces carpinensis]|uniref:Uncharacterized protein n=1 Tax=Streptomyces carpinensis TaxID=66369 RepID=A0ABV1VUR6_9ACTN|nr:hypothetical protein [Streptomyces carpinensis]
MATRDFAVRTENHVANLGELGKLEFIPEVLGDQFLDGYSKVSEAQKALGDENDLTKMDPAVLRSVYGAMREFLASLMVPESAERFLRFEVIKGGKTVAHFRTRAEADEHAGELTGAVRIEDKSLRLPDRVLMELLEWTTELYGGGTEDRPTTPSSGSSRASRRAGTPSKGSSRSKGSTSTAGRSAR